MDFEEKYDFTPATDGEMQGFEYAIPDGFTAEIKDGKVVVKKQYSEDERMVNRIISYLKQDIEEYPEREERINEMLAYLEKQKEQKPIPKFKVGDRIYNKKDIYNRKIIIEVSKDYYTNNFAQKMDMAYTDANFEFLEHLDNYTPASKPAVEQKPADYDHEMWKNCEVNFEGGKKEVINNPEKYGLCKPVEWSAYDKATIEYIIEDIKELRDEETNEEVIDTYDRELNLLQCINDSVKLCNYTNPAEWSEEDEKMLEKILCIIDPGVILTEDNREYCDELKSWLKSFPERFNLQPKQEWSKEDEKKLAGITAIIEEWWDNQSQKEKDYYGDQGYLSWLKSFRPQLKQQWSEEDESIKIELMDFISSAELSELLDEETQVKWYHWIEDKYGCSHWKPSEKQMKALYSLVFDGGITYVSQLGYLKSLYEDIKNL